MSERPRRTRLRNTLSISQGGAEEVSRSAGLGRPESAVRIGCSRAFRNLAALSMLDDAPHRLRLSPCENPKFASNLLRELRTQGALRARMRSHRPPRLSSVNTNFATAFSVSKTPSPVVATAGNSGTPSGFSSARSSSMEATAGMSRLLYWTT